MSVLRTLAYIIGPKLFWLGLFAFAIFSVISFNEQSLLITYLTMSVFSIASGLLITNYTAKCRNETVLNLLTNLF